MKRVASSETDTLYDEITAQIAEQQQKLDAYIKGPCPAAPLKGIEKCFAIMAKRVKEEITHSDDRSVSFSFWRSGRDEFEPREFQCGWWKRLIKWHEDVVQARHNYVAGNGSEEQADAFTDMVADTCYHDLHIAIADGWNALHPKLPGSWNDDLDCFIVKYTA